MKYWLIVVGALGMPVCQSRSQTPPAAPPPPVWKLSEDLRIGGADSGAKAFADIRGIVATKSGTIFALDYPSQELRVFDNKGAFVRLAAHGGVAPGDIASANGLAVGPDDVVWANDPRNRRISLYRPDGSFLGQVPVASPSSTPVWEGVVDQTGRAIDLPINVVGSRTDPDTHLPIAESGVRFIRLDGKADSVLYPSCAVSATPALSFFQFQKADGQGSLIRPIPFQSKQLVVVTRQGTVWCTPSTEYRLMTGSVGGALKEVVRVTMAPIPIPPEIRKQAVDRVDSIAKSYGPLAPGQSTNLIPENEPFIASLHADDQGHVWVRRTNMPDDAPFFDVFDATGKLIATVHGAGLIGSQVYIAGDELLTVTRTPAGVQLVIRYHITRL